MDRNSQQRKLKINQRTQDLNDVGVTNIQDNDALVWSDSNQQWENEAIDHASNVQNVGTNTHDQIDSHIANTSNPHGVTALQLGVIAIDITINSQSSNYTIQSSDGSKIIECTSNIVIYIPTGLDTGFQCLIRNNSTGTISIQGLSGVTIQAPGGLTDITERYARVSLIHMGSENWSLDGRTA